MNSINIGGRTIPLFYSTYELIQIQKEIGCTGFQLKEKVFGVRLLDEDDPESVVMDVITDGEKAEKMCTLLRILGNAGLEENGEEADLTDKWIMRNMKPGMIAVCALTALMEIAEGNRLESSEKIGSQGPVDEGLEEANSKKQPGNLHTCG